MASGVKNRQQREVANRATATTPLTLNERILKDCHQLYTDPDNGLIQIASSLGIKLLEPRKKITVMLIGNHSAGKSSFINWYIEEHVQRTGVAIETQGFSFITSGKKRESLTGNATLHLYPHYKPLADIPGLLDYLQTEISSSKQKKFPLVTFVDTPGLVDGDMNYPFDVNQAILWLGELVDLIFVFFDPIGQALCKRTLNIVEALNEKHSERIRFCLSKADEAGYENDRQRVMMQIVQELCKRPGLNRTGFDMPTIYIPAPNKQNVRCINQIEEVCRDIEKTINQNIQNTLNHLERDCDTIGSQVDKAIMEDNLARANNLQGWTNAAVFYLLGGLIGLLLILSLLTSSFSDQLLKDLTGPIAFEYLLLFIVPVRSFYNSLPTKYYFNAHLALLLLASIFFATANFLSKGTAVMTRKRKKLLLEQQDFVSNVVKAKKKTLYREYLEQTVSECDL